jgi:sugar lactone lactonase YvrE
MWSVSLNCVSVLRILFSSALFLSVLSPEGTAQCTPASSSTLDQEMASLQSRLNANPNDPVLLYNLAADYAAKCDAANTLALLHKVANSDGGLDPSQYRGFAFVRDSEEFKTIVAQIRARNPARMESHTAFVIKAPNLFPEGMAYARFNGRVYAGSVQRKIVWTNKDGAVHDLVKPGEEGLGYVAGLHIDEKRRQLWAVSSSFGDAPETSGMVQGLFTYDLGTGKRIATIVPTDKTGGYLNDVTVAPSSGDAYTTNTENGSVYVARHGARELQVFLSPGTVPGANGIALSDDEKTLFVAGDFGITRVDLQTKTAVLLPAPASVIDASVDGLYFYRQSLVGIQNGIHPGRVVRFYLDPGLTKITRGEILETYNPLFENPTTGCLDGDSFLFMANTQLHKWIPGKPLPPASELHDIRILRIILRNK